jgi:2-polyprenyl-3-methyl-5-hydroxy-6-metoxy-1,4-benzoquinol methylase
MSASCSEAFVRRTRRSDVSGRFRSDVRFRTCCDGVFFTTCQWKFTLTEAMNSSPHAPPATLGRVLHWAAGYDLLVWFFTGRTDRAFREQLAGLAHLVSGESVLDIGCGTGTLAIVAKRQVGANGRVFGIDASPEMIARATLKASKAGIDASFKNAVAEALPFPDAQFDVVLSTLMLHHLLRKLRQQCVPCSMLSCCSPRTPLCSASRFEATCRLRLPQA